MLIHTKLSTTAEHIQIVKDIIKLVANEQRLNEDFQNLIRSLLPVYFDEWVSGTIYLSGEVFVVNGSKYQMIVDMPKEMSTTDPYLATMRNYCLAFDGMYPSIWKFKEPVKVGMQRYPYQQETQIYTATRDALSSENLLPPDEDTTGLWELNPVSE